MRQLYLLGNRVVREKRSSVWVPAVFTKNRDRKGPGKEAKLSFMGHALMENRSVLRDNQKSTFSDNQPMHLMVEHASLGATPVKPKPPEAVA
jgi:hypothetical protein